MVKTALIMAGGRGERFWPRSRKQLPKQFLSLTSDGRTMIQLAVERILPLVDMENIYIATNRDYRELVRQQLPQIPEENILCEPAGRNTAPCIGLGAIHMQRRYGDAVMYVLPSDHLIKYTAMFTGVLRAAYDTALKEDSLVTIGITPTYPETGYGYIKFDTQHMHGSAYAVERFVEKPTLDKAEEYVRSEQYLWNSGMFTWKVSTLLRETERWMPDVHKGLGAIAAAIGTPDYERVLEREFLAMPSVSIDYGVMEKAENIYILPGNFGWDDVGSWLAVGRINTPDADGNVLFGTVIPVDTHACIVQGADKLIATVGVEDLIVVDTPDATLVCNKNSAGHIKQVLEELRNRKMDSYL